MPNSVVLVNWTEVDNTVFLEYSDGDSFYVLKSDFDRCFGPIISCDKKIIQRDFALRI